MENTTTFQKINVNTFKVIDGDEIITIDEVDRYLHEQANAVLAKEPDKELWFWVLSVSLEDYRKPLPMRSKKSQFRDISNGYSMIMSRNMITSVASGKYAKLWNCPRSKVIDYP